MPTSPKRLSLRLARVGCRRRSFEGCDANQVTRQLALARHRRDGCRRERELRHSASLQDFEAVFFDDRICEHFLGNAVELLLRFVAVPAVQIEDEKLAL